MLRSPLLLFVLLLSTWSAIPTTAQASPYAERQRAEGYRFMAPGLVTQGIVLGLVLTDIGLSAGGRDSENLIVPEMIAFHTSGALVATTLNGFRMANYRRAPDWELLGLGIGLLEGTVYSASLGALLLLRNRIYNEVSCGASANNMCWEPSPDEVMRSVAAVTHFHVAAAMGLSGAFVLLARNIAINKGSSTRFDIPFEPQLAISPGSVWVGLRLSF